MGIRFAIGRSWLTILLVVGIAATARANGVDDSRAATPARMRQLLQKRRLCGKLTGECSRTNTDLPGGKATVKSIFRNQTKGQKVEPFTPDSGGIGRRAENGAQIRFKHDGSVSLDLPGRGPNPPGTETIHFRP